MSDKNWYVVFAPYKELNSKSADPFAFEKEKISREPYRILERYKTTELFVREYATGALGNLINPKSEPKPKSELPELGSWATYLAPNSDLAPSKLVSYQHVIAPYTPEELDREFCNQIIQLYKEGKIANLLKYHFESYQGEAEDFIEHVEQLSNNTLDKRLINKRLSITPLFKKRIKFEVQNWIHTERTRLNKMTSLNSKMMSLTSKKDSSRTKPATQKRTIQKEEKHTIVRNYYLELVNGKGEQKPLDHDSAILKMLRIFNGSQQNLPKIGESKKSRRDMINKIIKPISRKKRDFSSRKIAPK